MLILMFMTGADGHTDSNPKVGPRTWSDYSYCQITQDHPYHPMADANGHSGYSHPQIDQKLFLDYFPFH